MVGGLLCEKLGRRPVILLASFIFAIGAIIMAFSNSKEILVTGRIIVGVSIGFASTSVPIYISESAPTKLRGILVCCYQLAITVGILVAAIVCGLLANVKPDGWKYMLGLSVLPALMQMAGSAFLPESPRWLAAQGRLLECEKVLRDLRGDFEEADGEAGEILCSVDEENKAIEGRGGFAQILQKV